MPLVPPKAAPTIEASMSLRTVRSPSLEMSDKARALLLVALVIFISIVINHIGAVWLKLPKHKATYRRIGPQSGPQVFCAGSSLLQFALSWPEISETLGQGIESWGLAGSTPSEWEYFQSHSGNTDLMIIGVSMYDLNERHLCDSRADVVPLSQTIQDLWQTQTDFQSARRLLTQYPQNYLRKLFPTAGRSEAVLVGFRRKFRELLRLPSADDDRAIAEVVPEEAVLRFGESKQKVSDWTRGQAIRRIALLSSENQGVHAFDGPKNMALRRMLTRAQQQGRVTIVVLPLAPMYVRWLTTPEVLQNFESALAEAERVCPQAQVVRLDRLSALNSDDYYGDLVHLNGAGRRIATDAFLNWLRQHSKS